MSHRKTQKIKYLSLTGLVSAALLITTSSYANEYIKSAEKYLNNNEINAAIIELKNAIQSTPKDAKPRFVLGQIYLQRGSYASAEKELSRALHLGANKSDVIPLLARAISNQGKNEEVIELVDESNISNSNAKAELLGLKAIAEINLRNTKTAASIITQAHETDTQAVYPLLAEARLKLMERDLKGALESVDQALKIDNKNSDIQVLKGHLEFSQQQFSDATNDYKKALEISPDAVHYNLFIARALVYSKEFSQAQPYVQKILNIVPNHPLANELESTILYSEEQYADAKEHADTAINNGSQNIAILLISALSDYKLKLYEQANNRLKQVVPHLPDNHFAKRLYIVTLMRLGHINEAIENLDQLNVTSKENNQFLSQMSMELSRLGRDEEALSMANKAYKNDQNSSNELMLGLVKLADNDATGLKELQSVIAEQPDKRKAEIGVAYYYVKAGKVEEASEVADKWLKQNPNDYDALTLKGKIYQINKQFDQAETAFKKALNANPDFIHAQLSLGQVLASQGKMEESYQAAYKAKQLAPDNESATQLLFITSKRLGKIPEVLTLINNQLDQNPADLTLTHQKAQAQVFNNQFSDAIKTLENLPDDQKSAKTWSLIGDIYYIQKQWYDAERAYSKWLDLAPSNAQAYVRNINISERTNKLAIGLNIAKQATKEFPNDIRFTLMKAGLLIKSKQYSQAQDILDSLPENVKNIPYSVKLQSLLFVLNKEFDKAVSLQEKIYNDHPGLVTANSLASAYVLNQQNQKAIDFLTKVIDEYPQKSRPLKLLLADIQSKTHPEDAIKQYTTIIDKEPKNIIALNNLSWIYMDKNQLSKACEYSERAYNLAKEQPAIADTHGYCLLKLGNVNKANELLEAAYHGAKANSEIALHYAESLIKKRKTAQAQNILMDVATNDPKLINLKNDLEEMIKNM